MIKRFNKIIILLNRRRNQNDEKKTFLPKNHKNFSKPDDFALKVLEKIELNFLNENFMRKILEVLNSPEEMQEHESLSLIEKLLKFSQECYIHGVTAGMHAAVEIYEENE